MTHAEPLVPEFPRPLLLERIPPHGYEITVSATQEECAALTARLRIPAVDSLTCRFHLHPLPRGTVAARGELRARIVQNCVVSLDDFTTDIVESFQVRFVVAGTETDDLDLASADPESEDEIPYDGASIDLGEAAAEQLALTLDPYPRKPDAELPAVATDPEPSPFAALEALRRKN
jgi:hypothetical protein